MEIVFSLTNTDNIPNVALHEIETERVPSAPFLGISIDCNLTWSTHVQNFTKAARGTLFLLRQLKRPCGFSKDSYSQCAKPKLTYA